MTEVAVVIVTYNRLSLLIEEVDSIRAQSYTNYKIIVVNNGSTDNTKEWLSTQSDLIVIHQDNTGGAGGFHTGIKYAVENGFKYCWIMDDDVICSPNALEVLVNSYNKKSNIGFVCSKVWGIDGCIMNTPVVDNRPGGNGYADYSDLINEQMIKVRNATFVSVFFSTKLVAELGLPYKEYFIWGDDYEYTNRISSKYDSYLVCNSNVIHKRSVQKALSFDEETDSKRIKNYFYKFRNESFNHIKEYNLGILGRGKQCFKYLRLALKSLFKLNFCKSLIYFRVSTNIATFNPVVEYPKVESL